MEPSPMSLKSRNRRLLAVAAVLLLAHAAHAQTKLSQINNGGTINTATDQCVAVRGGTTDELVTIGSLPNSSLANSSMTLAGHSVALGGTQAFACGDLNNAAASCSTDATNAANISTGTLAAARGGAGTITGALKGNGAGVVSQAACADLSDSGTACSVPAPANTTATTHQFFTAYVSATGAFTKAQPACADVSNAGTVCTQNTGTSGANVPLLNATNTWGKGQIATQSTPAISTATFTPDFSAGNHFIINLVHASCPCTLANPTNIVAGQSGVIAVVQSATGSDTITSYGSDYIFTNTTSGVLSTAASATDYYSYYVEDATHIRMNFIAATPQYVGTGGIISNQTKFTISGCSASTTVGGATAGKYTSGTTGTCTVTITMNGATGITAPNGWSCWANDETTTADQQQTTSSTTTTATISGTTVSGDVIDFGCVGF